jgi:hypothetical protein
LSRSDVLHLGGLALGAVLLVGAVLAARPALAPAAALVSPPMAPAAAMSSSSSLLAGAISPGGAGFGFFAVQRTTEYQRPGGIPIPVVDPADGRTVTGQTGRLFINAMMSKGFVTPDDFSMEMRPGTEAAASAAAFAAAPSVFSVLARDGGTWRNDGAGWYATSGLPGMGIDLATARLLPRALGHIGSLSAAVADTVNGSPSWAYTGTVAVADYPGAVAADGAAFTDPAVAVKVWVDAKGRPLQLWVRARNTNQAAYDLVSETTVTLDYGAAPPLPRPDPTMAPEPPPPPDPAAAAASPQATGGAQ